MCGICGFISKNCITTEQLTAMNDEMIHRGPDDAGAEIYDARGGYTVGLAQRRLSIIDLSPLGHQPMHSEGGRLSVSYNGEIYNFLELKEELTDYPFRSGSDTEVILAAYLKWGTQCFARFDGMFAIALYDRETDELILARDRMGKKPLYYWLQDGNLVFASGLAPIMRCPGFEKKIRADILPRYLYQQYINAPDTIFENVYKLEPGSYLIFKDGQAEKTKFWDVASVYAEQAADPAGSYDEAKEELKKRLQRAVRLRMISDVPLGSFLSGGYDSSLVSALAQEASEQPLKTFSIGFAQKEYDEAVFAKEVAAHLGTDHTELYIDEPEMFRLVESIPRYFDEPFADSSQIPTMLVSMLARRKVTVALSGDGGDEFYCGYGIYRRVQQAQKLDKLGAVAHGIGKIGGLESRYPFRLRVISANRDKETKTQFGEGSYAKTARELVLPAAGGAVPTAYPFESRYHTDNWQVRRMLLDMDTYLPGDILCKVDRASMKYSLECRCPILDTDVMEYSFRIPHEYKFGADGGKLILKDIAYDYIPRELLDRPKKGFSVPLDQWLRGPLRQQLTDYTDPGYLKKQGLFDADNVGRFVGSYLNTGDAGAGSGKNYSRLCWAFFTFQQWYETYFA